MIKKYFPPLFVFIALLGAETGKALAQTPTMTETSTETSVFSPTFTSTPGCCQVAQTITGQGGAGNFGLSAYETVNSAGTTLYVADFNKDEVQEFSLSNGTVTPVGTITGLGFNQPYALALDNQGYLYVGEYGGEVVKKIKLSNNSLVATITAGGNVGGVALDTNGDLYVSSVSGTPVQIFQAPVTSPNSYSQVGTAAVGTSTNPRGLLKVGNELYLVDATSEQLLEYTQGSGYNFTGPTTLVGDGQLDLPLQIARDGNGNFYVASNGGLVVFNPDFSLNHICELALNHEQGVALDNQGYMYMSGQDSSTGAWEVLQLSPCLMSIPPPSTPTPTPTPVFQGNDPPGNGQCFIYPSPARGDHATVCYKMEQAGKVELKVWDEKAELVTDIIGSNSSGVKTTAFNISGLSSGLYFYGLVLSYNSGTVDRLQIHKFIVIH